MVINFKKINWFIFGIIIIFGFFLRMINFNDWLVFKSDQARDAIIMDRALEKGFSSLPLLGPQVRGDSFSSWSDY